MIDMVSSILRYAAIIAVIVLGFKFLKNQNNVTVEPADHSMEPGYPAASYKVDISFVRPSQFTQGMVVSYWVPTHPEVQKVARVIALEGQRVDIDGPNIKINGNSCPLKFDGVTSNVHDFKVPRGCLFVLAEKSDLSEDSVTIGPVPMYAVQGKVEDVK